MQDQLKINYKHRKYFDNIIVYVYVNKSPHPNILTKEQLVSMFSIFKLNNDEVKSYSTIWYLLRQEVNKLLITFEAQKMSCDSKELRKI